MKLDKILVPVDGSTLAEVALSKALDLTREDGGTISLLRAAEAYTLPGADSVEAQVIAAGFRPLHTGRQFVWFVGVYTRR